MSRKRTWTSVDQNPRFFSPNSSKIAMGSCSLSGFRVRFALPFGATLLECEFFSESAMCEKMDTFKCQYKDDDYSDIKAFLFEELNNKPTTNVLQAPSPLYLALL